MSETCDVGVPDMVMISGGAEGMDRVFFDLAVKHGVGYRILVPNGAVPAYLRHPDGNKNVWTLDSDVTPSQKLAVAATAKKVGKRCPSKPFVMALIARDMEVARTASAMFAVVSTHVAAVNQTTGNIGVEGGTGWTCQRFFDLQIAAYPQATTLPLFVFDLSGKWLQIVRDFDAVSEEVPWKWQVLGGRGNEDALPALPMLEPGKTFANNEFCYACIGSRECGAMQVEAAADLMKRLVSKP